MSDALPICVDPQCAANPRTGAALHAASCGRADLSHDLRVALGTDYGWDRACHLVRHDPNGLRVAQGDGEPIAADVILDPTDAGHTHEYSDRQIVFRRSALAGQRTFPAWPLRPTVALHAQAPRASAQPIVSFCGVAHRPNVRRLLVERFSNASGIDFRLIARSKFLAADLGDMERANREFVDSIITAQYVVAPVGVGNFSYRVAETLAAGRVPVVDQLQHGIPPAAIVVRTGPGLGDPVEAVRAHHATIRDWREVAQHNKSVWLTEMSAFAWVRHFVREVRNAARLDVTA